jgi:uncharacterized Zn finger protein
MGFRLKTCPQCMTTDITEINIEPLNSTDTIVEYESTYECNECGHIWSEKSKGKKLTGNNDKTIF